MLASNCLPIFLMIGQVFFEILGGWNHPIPRYTWGGQKSLTCRLLTGRFNDWKCSRWVLEAKMFRNGWPFFNFSMWKRRHISKIYYIMIMKILLKSLYDTRLWSIVPFYNQKCHFRCSRDLNFCNRRKNGPKWPFLTSFWGPPCKRRKYFGSRIFLKVA